MMSLPLNLPRRIYHAINLLTKNLLVTHDFADTMILPTKKITDKKNYRQKNYHTMLPHRLHLCRG